MIELHFHCLPGIDDGPPGWDEALALCRAAAADGVETIVATPHVLRECQGRAKSVPAGRSRSGPAMGTADRHRVS
jgi:tyrosine-protein phosphatase YwqE